jgi:phosphoglycolate phosphatase-like HAD superfamily hydrolase
MLEAIHYCHAFADLFIVSNANMDFIQAFLEKEGIQRLFTRVISNTLLNAPKTLEELKPCTMNVIWMDSKPLVVLLEPYHPAGVSTKYQE